jgi:hypothetical protein
VPPLKPGGVNSETGYDSVSGINKAKNKDKIIEEKGFRELYL